MNGRQLTPRPHATDLPVGRLGIAGLSVVNLALVVVVLVLISIIPGS